MMTPTELQEALRPIETQLTRLADLIAQLTTLEPTPEQDQVPTEPIPCSHPLEHRTDFGQTYNQPDWQCNLCAYRSVAP